MAEQGGRGGELPENGIFGGVTDGNIDIVAAGSVGFEVEVVGAPLLCTIHTTRGLARGGGSCC